MRSGIYLSFHALMDSEQTVTEVHDVAEELEARLRHQFPHLSRVVIHTEPYRP
jgi:divalent metal cation (Fe/Co/Zn/Cd) transporter